MNIGYHTRLDIDNKVKVVGGSFGGSLDMETANRLVASQFTVVVKPSGRAVFVDGSGRQVSLYISVDASSTVVGRAALKAYYKVKAKSDAEQEALHEKQSNELESLMGNLTHDEIVQRLKGDQS